MATFSAIRNRILLASLSIATAGFADPGGIGASDSIGGSIPLLQNYSDEIFIRKNLMAPVTGENEQLENPYYLKVIRELNQALPYRLSARAILPMRFKGTDGEWRGFKVVIPEGCFAQVTDTDAHAAMRKIIRDTIEAGAAFLTEVYLRNFGQNRGIYFPRTVEICSSIFPRNPLPATTAGIPYRLAYDYTLNKITVDLFRGAPTLAVLLKFWKEGSFFTLPTKIYGTLQGLKPPSKLEVIGGLIVDKIPFDLGNKVVGKLGDVAEKKKEEALQKIQTSMWELVDPMGEARSTARKAYLEYFKGRSNTEEQLIAKAKALDPVKDAAAREKAESEIVALFDGVAPQRPDNVSSPSMPHKRLTPLPYWDELADMDLESLQTILGFMRESASDPSIVESIAEAHMQGKLFASMGMMNAKTQVEVTRKLTGKPVVFDDFTVDLPGTSNIDLDDLNLPNGIVVANYKDISVAVGQVFQPLAVSEQRYVGSMKPSEQLARKIVINDTIDASVIVDLVDVINIDISLGNGMVVDSAEIERGLLRIAWLRWQKAQRRAKKPEVN